MGRSIRSNKGKRLRTMRRKRMWDLKYKAEED